MFNRQTRELIIELYKDGFAQNEISRLLFISRHGVSDSLSKKNIKLRTNNKAHNEVCDFFDRIKINTKTQCWEWNHVIMRNGYGVFNIAGTAFLVHRFSYQLFYGEIKEQFVCHKCDNPICCNPTHLFLGDCIDNNMDMIKKGRCKFIIKLSNQKAALIRSEYAQESIIKKLLAEKYKISVRHLRDILKGKYWREKKGKS